MHSLKETLDVAAEHIRGGYAKDVIYGRQYWSGADLRGAAKDWGGSYARQRRLAREALEAAGGYVIAVDHGRLVSAVLSGQDDFGNALFQTIQGLAVQHTANQARIIRRRR